VHLAHVAGGPKQACTDAAIFAQRGGLASLFEAPGACYSWLGIDEWDAFSGDVVHGLNEVT